MESDQTAARQRVPWNKGKLVGQKAPSKPKDVWAIRARMAQQHRTRELALFNLGIDSKLRGCDLIALRVRDIQHGAQIDRGRNARYRAPAAQIRACTIRALGSYLG